MSQNEPEQNGTHRSIMPFLLVLTIWAVVIVLSSFRYSSVKPLPDSIADDRFSAARADKFLKELVGDSIPHPAGSTQNKIVRNRIVKALESFGYSVEIQTGTGKVAWQVKDRSSNDHVELQNIIAIRRALPNEAQSRRQPIMLASHYDSHPAGPGASDDGVATAALLEIARILSTEPPPNRDVVFLITDGEELGLLGAKLFVNEHPLAKEIQIAINLEARGTSGPSCMFETSRDSRMLIPIFSRATEKKFASSLFVEIYRRMPRDTDFSVFRRAGILGYNFAFIGDVQNYHTTADNYENASKGSLQHHGDNALGLLRELLDSLESQAIAEVDSESSEEAVYFDLFGKWIVWWPANWSIWFSSSALLMFAGWARIMTRAKPHSQPKHQSRNLTTEIASHLGIQVLTIILVFGVGYLIQSAVRLDPRLSHPWPALPIPIAVGYWLAGLATVGALALTFSSQIRLSIHLIAFCVIWLVLAFATSVSVTGASHLFIVPILGTCAFGSLACWFGQRGVQANLMVAAALVGIMWIPLERIFYDAVGFRMPIVMMARMAIVTSTLLGLFSLASDRMKFILTMLAAVASVVAFVVAIALTG